MDLPQLGQNIAGQVAVATVELLAFVATQFRMFPATSAWPVIRVMYPS